MHRLRVGISVRLYPMQAPPSAGPAATSPSSFDRLRIDGEDLAYLASADLGFPLFVILNLFQDNAPHTHDVLNNYRDRRDNPKIGFACNVGFVLRFCALSPQLLRDRLFEPVDPQPGFHTRKANLEKLR